MTETGYSRFNYNSFDELEADIKRLGLEIPFEREISCLSQKLKIGSSAAPNRIGIHPMEGCDGLEDGSPGELTIRRYSRFRNSGAGLIWYEATAVNPGGRANPRQLYLHERNVAEFAALLGDKAAGSSEAPFTVLQLTHSGRYSKPTYEGPKPVIAFHDLYLDKAIGIPEDYPIITDGEIERLEDDFVKSAGLACKAGFNAVDIKSCHRYLPSELLAAHKREGRYGGSYENRTRFIKNVVGKVRAAYGEGILIATRLNAFDYIPYPYGFGMDRNSEFRIDLDETKRLVRELVELGVSLINLSAGNPYYNPHIGRPYDSGPYIPIEHQLIGIERLLRTAFEIQKTVPVLPIMATGFSWLRQFAPNVGAGLVKEGGCSIVGFGRMAFAYPDFARDLFDKGSLDPSKVCVACGRCTVIMRDGGRTGCVPKDAGIYAGIFKEGRSGKPPLKLEPEPTWHI